MKVFHVCSFTTKSYSCNSQAKHWPHALLAWTEMFLFHQNMPLCCVGFQLVTVGTHSLTVVCYRWLNPFVQKQDIEFMTAQPLTIGPSKRCCFRVFEPIGYNDHLLCPNCISLSIGYGVTISFLLHLWLFLHWLLNYCFFSSPNIAHLQLHPICLGLSHVCPLCSNFSCQHLHSRLAISPTWMHRWKLLPSNRQPPHWSSC